jgi:proteasome lid subunit RPN8/RPN11
VLEISQAEYEAMRGEAESAYPAECCGVLLGTRGATNRVAEIVAVDNASEGDAGTRYSIAPEALIAAQKQARERGLEVVGFYHSHPDCAARWSQTDLAQAFWSGCSYVITAVMSGSAEQTNSFRLAVSESGSQLVDEPIEVVGAVVKPL